MYNSRELSKRILCALYLYSLRMRSFGPSLDERSKSFELSQYLDLSKNSLSKNLFDLERQGYVKSTRSETPKLTEAGRQSITVVMIGGAFDIIHPGHLETFRQAKKLGDLLVVSVSRNSTYEKNRHKGPQHDEKLRRELVASIKEVDAAVLGSETNIFETVEFFEPDIIALGYDQVHSEDFIDKEARRSGVPVKVVRLSSSIPDAKTSKIFSSDKSKSEILSET